MTPPPNPIRGGQWSCCSVENEIYLLTENTQDLADLQSRWPTTVLSETELGDFGPEGDGATLVKNRVECVLFTTRDPL